MAPTASPARPVCQIGIVGDYVRASVGPGRPGEVRQCYEDWACACLLGEYRRALLVGASEGDAFPHLAARDAIDSMALAGIPAQFRLAVVALNAHLIAVYDAAVVAALRHGIDARRFQDEADAVRWLRGEA